MNSHATSMTALKAPLVRDANSPDLAQKNLWHQEARN
jgi:hypothetical protein